MKTVDAKCTLNTPSLIENMVTIDNFEDLVSIIHINAANTNEYQRGLLPADLMDINAFMMILVQKGHAEISLDYKTHSIASNKLAVVVPNHVFQITKISNDFKAEILVLDKLFLEEISREKKGSYNYFSFKRNPVTKLESNEKKDLEETFLLLHEKIKLRTHLFYRELVHNTVVGLLLELLNILGKKKSDLVYTTLSRKEDLVDKFLKLLAQYAKEEHLLSFYADKLFITPQYLSSILKEQTGKGGSKWINEALVLEAKKLIKSHQSTIQEVAYALNFSDQSTFGKFFKKSMGISPLGYRRL